ncbi:MAG: L-threonylcarbamoyladenylate synthase [bacterium]
MPKILRVDHAQPDSGLAVQVANVLKGGGVIAMRTDTVYGLLASVNRPDALKKLVALKVRPVGKPFVLLCADWIGVRAVTSHLPPVARTLGTRYWPGPLTLVLPADDNLPEEVTAAGKTVAVRMPGDPLVREILREMRAALAAPSANLPGQSPAPDVDAVVRLFGAGIDLALDGGAAPARAPSTIVNCCGSTGEILRVGPIVPTPEELAAH